MIHELVYRIEELERRMANVMRVGRVVPGSQDHTGGTVKVMDGTDQNDPDGWVSSALPWKEHSGQHSTRTMPSDNQQVVVFSPGGTMEIGWVSHGGFMQSDDMPSAPNGETVSRRREVQSGASGTSGGSADQQKDILTTDYQGNRTTNAYQSHTTVVGDYTITTTKDGGHVFSAGGAQATSQGGAVSNPDYSITMTKDGGIVHQAGTDQTLTIKKSDGFHFVGGTVTHNGLPIDATHKHTDVQPGSGLTGIPSAA